MSYRNDSVTRRLVKDHGVSQRVADAWCEELLKFLAIGATLQDDGKGWRAVPSPAVDAAWHAFILDTAAYAEYCQSQFGRFIHHQPTDDAASASTQMDATLDYLHTRLLVQRRFGPLRLDIWPLP